MINILSGERNFEQYDLHKTDKTLEWKRVFKLIDLLEKKVTVEMMLENFIEKKPIKSTYLNPEYKIDNKNTFYFDKKEKENIIQNLRDAICMMPEEKFTEICKNCEKQISKKFELVN